jgi:hypothetical protein
VVLVCAESPSISAPGTARRLTVELGDFADGDLLIEQSHRPKMPPPVAPQSRPAVQQRETDR